MDDTQDERTRTPGVEGADQEGRALALEAPPQDGAAARQAELAREAARRGWMAEPAPEDEAPFE